MPQFAEGALDEVRHPQAGPYLLGAGEDGDKLVEVPLEAAHGHRVASPSGPRPAPVDRDGGDEAVDPGART